MALEFILKEKVSHPIPSKLWDSMLTVFLLSYFLFSHLFIGVMTAKGIHMLWMVFSLAWIVWETEATSFEQFKKMHLDYPKTPSPNSNAYCEQMMKSRHLTKGKSNVFIHVSEDTLKQTCPKEFTGEWTSANRLPLTLCIRINEYLDYSGIYLPYRFRVYCQNGLPVEFKGLASK